MTIDWDDVRYFLAVARHGSVRAAATQLDVNHTTILRRVAQLETRLHSLLFEKLPAGYRLTEAGEQVQELAEQMETASNLLVSRVSGRDEAVRGPLRVTMAPTLATHLLMPDFADFARQHPEIEMEIHSSLENANLTNREADVALRVVFNRNSLPQNLHGMKGPNLSVGVYMSRELLAAWKTGTSRNIRWISKNIESVPEWAHSDEVAITGAPLRVTEDEAHLEAMRLGLGISALPSFVGDGEPLLVRVPGTAVGPHGTLWVLTQGEARKTKRVRLFTEFISERLRGKAGLLAGDVQSRERSAKRDRRPANNLQDA